MEEAPEETLSSSEDISQGAAEGDRAALEKVESSKMVGAEELFVLFGRLRFKRLRAGLMNVACNRKELGFWPFSTWCLADSCDDEENVGECSSASSSDDAEFLQGLFKEKTAEEEISAALWQAERDRKEKERVEHEAWWSSLMPDEKQDAIEWESLKAIYKVGLEN